MLLDGVVDMTVRDAISNTPLHILASPSQKLLIGIWPGERIVDKVSRFVGIEESCIDS